MNERYIKTENAEVDKMMSVVIDLLRKQGEQVSPFISETFDPDLFQSLPEEIRGDEQELAVFVLNMSKFSKIISLERRERSRRDMSGLLGEEIQIEETTHSNDRKRRAESGKRVNIDFLRDQGIDPTKVLFFRSTQPADQPKPEFYWTSDYYETRRGLRREISQEKRKTAIILVASLDVINKNGGLIQDINDDSGLAVRQIGTDNFDQNLALTEIIPSE